MVTRKGKIVTQKQISVPSKWVCTTIENDSNIRKHRMDGGSTSADLRRTVQKFPA